MCEQPTQPEDEAVAHKFHSLFCIIDDYERPGKIDPVWFYDNKPDIGESAVPN